VHASKFGFCVGGAKFWLSIRWGYPLGGPEWKHIDIQNHYCREKVNDGTVEFQYIPTGKQVADVLTKALAKDRFILFRKALGLKERRP
jgi:hypothetical protein